MGSLQTILGSGGAVGVELAKALKRYKSSTRLVSRHPVAVNPDDELFIADLTKAEDVSRAVKGSAVVYLTAGLPYKTTVWQETWPVVIRNVLEACKTHHAKLVFFDNIYMCEPHYLGRMTEETPIC